MHEAQSTKLTMARKGHTHHCDNQTVTNQIKQLRGSHFEQRRAQQSNCLHEPLEAEQGQMQFEKFINISIYGRPPPFDELNYRALSLHYEH